MASTVNSALGAIEQRRQLGGEQQAALQDIANRYERLAQHLQQLRFSTPDLHTSVADYARSFGRTATAVRTTARALGRDDRQAIAQQRHKLAALMQKEKTQARRIDLLCSAP